MTVRLEWDGDLAIVTIDNPPVNVISQAVRQGLLEALERASHASRVILTGAGRAFVAGADAREFDAPPRAPHLPEVVARIGGFPVPVVAAINGAALGGGLELALACAARVAAPAAFLGLPEVTLGVVPGAGGTQLLPRLTGLAAALPLISEGRAVGAAEALSLGLVDLVADDPVAAARSLLLPKRPATCDMPMPAADAEAVEKARRTVARRSPGQIAPGVAVDLVEKSSRLPLAEGLAAEREAFLRLKTGDQAAALRHVFFAERAAMGQGRKEGAEIASAVVVGGGTMGAGISYALAQAGIRVALVETDEAALGRARANVGQLYSDAVKRGKLSAEKAIADHDGRFSYHVGYGALPDADLAIEAVFEDIEVKRRVFAALDGALPRAVLATNTSYLDVNLIARELSDPSRFLGLHFFSPAHVMKLLEVVRADATSPVTLATALRLGARLGKIPVLAGVCDGFIGNRILTRYRQCCDVMLIEGALPAQVDIAMRGFGMAMGPYEVQDLSGLDIAYANRKHLGWKTKPGHRYIPIADRIVDETGRLGRKSGAGWYDHGDGGQTPSALIDDLVRDTSAQAGIVRRTFSDAEIVERATAAMVEEGFSILEEGIAEKPSDIDLVMILGYAFPRWRGGPMHWAGRVGLSGIMFRIEGYTRTDPLSWNVPDLMRRVVAEGKTPEEI